MPVTRRSRTARAAKAYERATHLEELITRGSPAPWALRLEPIPAWLQPLAGHMVDRQIKNALKLMKESAQLLRTSCSHLVTQGNLNWNIVSKYFHGDDQLQNKARLKMDAFVAKDFDKEQTRLDAKAGVLIATPVKHSTIVENLKVRGYTNPNKRSHTTSPPRNRNVVTDGPNGPPKGHMVLAA